MHTAILNAFTQPNWSIHFGWVKAHAGIEGNEAANTLVEEAAQDEEDRNFVYDRIPTSTIAASVKEAGFKILQAQWERAEKGAICRSFFPIVEQRLKLRIPITPEFTAIVSGHGKTKVYLNRFNLTDNPMCPCNEGEQSGEHLIYIYMQNTGTPKKLHDTTCNDQRWELAPLKQRTSNQILKRLCTIC